ncbi:MAG: type II toxin-antitoxin system RelE/ParE family toxin [Acidimicrobiia bacterium]|nr:type II toxin-antitoxin system RelE/ParE family toxin [Acidimicrobiia bacterium]
MTWRVEIERRAARELRKLDRPIQNRILEFLRGRVATSEGPRRLGRALTGQLSSVWRYRIGDYRRFCAIEDTKSAVRVLRIGRRDEVYR